MRRMDRPMLFKAPKTFVTYRYWRLTVTNRSVSNVIAVSGQVQIATLALYVGASRYPAAMTTDTAPSPLVATASSEAAAVYYLFDSDPGNSSNWISANSSTPEWAQIDLGAGNGIAPDTAGLACNNQVSFGNFPVDFTIDASNTGAFAGEQHNALTVVGASTGWVSYTMRYWSLS